MQKHYNIYCDILIYYANFKYDCILLKRISKFISFFGWKMVTYALLKKNKIHHYPHEVSEKKSTFTECLKRKFYFGLWRGIVIQFRH